MNSWKGEAKMWKRLACLTVLLILAAGILTAQEAGQNLLNQDEVYHLIKKEKKHPDVIENSLHAQGVDFDINPQIEQRMRKAGATDEILRAIWAAGPTVRNFKGAVLTSATGTPLTSSYKEAMGYVTLEKVQDPATKIRMAEEFVRTFPKSDLLSYVYTQEATAYQQEGNFPKAVEFGRKSLQLDPDNTYSLLVTATTLSEPSMARSAEDRTKTLLEAKGDAQRALDLLPKVPARENETAEQLAERKAGIASDGHAALGSVAMLQDDFNQAIEEFNQAISLSKSPKPSLYFRLGEVYTRAGKKPEAIQAFSKAAELGKGTVIETYANQSIKELQEK